MLPTISREPDYGGLQRAIPLLARLSHEHIKTLLTVAKMVPYPERAVVIQHGELGPAMFLIVKGKVRASSTGRDGTITHTGDRGPGETIGELSLLMERPFTSTVVTLEPSMLLALDRVGFQRLRAARDPAALLFLRAIAPVVCARLRAVHDQLDRLFAPDSDELERAFLGRGRPGKGP